MGGVRLAFAAEVGMGAAVDLGGAVLLCRARGEGVEMAVAEGPHATSTSVRSPTSAHSPFTALPHKWTISEHFQRSVLA